MNLKTSLLTTLGVNLTGGGAVGGYYLFRPSKEPNKQIADSQAPLNQEETDSKSDEAERSSSAPEPTALTPNPQERQPNGQDQGTGGQAQQAQLTNTDISDTGSRENR